MTQTLRYAWRDTTYAITLIPQPDGALLAEVDGSTFVVRAERSGDLLRLWIDGLPPITLTAVARGSERLIALDGESYTLTREDNAPKASRRAARDPRLICTAQMPGQVRAVMVNAGDLVQRGQPLAILEAMKMELRIVAEAAGRVVTVSVQVGDVVERGQMLVELAAEGE